VVVGTALTRLEIMTAWFVEGMATISSEQEEWFRHKGRKIGV